VSAADLEDRRVEIAGREVAQVLRRVRLVKVENEDVRALALLPSRPVPVEKGVGKVGLCSGSPPSSGRKKTCGSPARVETNASVRPSGEKNGCSSLAPENVRGRAFFPSASIRQRATVFFFAVQSFVPTLYTTVLPSGEIAGSPTLLTR
jgi:hypothetical protein